MNRVDIDTLEPEIYIPLFRARKLNSDEYVIGQYYYNKNKNLHLISYTYTMPIRDGFTAVIECTARIDINTLAINFPDMIDSEKTKIFASLSKFGTGGSITETKDGYKIYNRVHLFFKDGTRGSKDLDVIKILSKKYNSVLDIKCIGIKE